ncbi:MAG: 1-deoxy-D-xylulose-5-phosphate synthase, partial [Fervidobacterium sp.]
VVSYYNDKLLELYPDVKIKKLGVEDNFITHGTRKELLQLVKLDCISVENTIKSYVEKCSLKGVRRI